MLNKHYLDTIVSETDYLIESTYKSAEALSHQGAVINLGFIDELDSTIKSNIFSLLSNSITDTSLIDYAFIYLPSLDSVIVSSFRTYTLESCPWVNIINTYYQSDNLYPIYIDGSPTSCFLYYQDNNIYLVYEYLFSGNPKKVTLFFRINTWRLYQIIQNYTPDTTSVWIFWNDGKPLLSSYVNYPEFLTDSAISSLTPDYYEEIEKNWVLTLNSTITNWKYVYILPNNTMQVFSIDSLLPNVVLFFILLAIAAVSSYIISKRLYAPIKDLYNNIQSVAGMENHEISRNEFDYINRSFSKVSDNSQRIQQIISTMAPNVTLHLLEELLFNKNANYDYILNNLNNIIPEFHPDNLYSVGIVQWTFPESGQEVSSETISFLCASLNTFCIRENIIIYILQTDTNMLITVLSIEKPENILTFSKKLKNLRHMVSKITIGQNVKFIFASGNIYNSILNIRFSYKDALDYLASRQSDMAGEELETKPLYSETISKPQYSQDIYHILVCIQENEFNRATALGKSLAEKMNGNQATVEECQNIFHELYNQISEIKYINLSLFNDQLFHCTSSNDFACNLNEILSILISQKKKTQNHYILMAQKQVEKKYNNGDTSLASIAEEIGTNPTYLSKLFKQNLGVTFSEYFNRYRVEQSLILLRTTNKSIQDIAEQCGFNSPQNYIRVFKKYYQTTPNQYRNHNSENV